MAKDVMAESAALLGDSPVSPSTYTPNTGNSKAGKLLESLEDTERDTEVAIKRAKDQINNASVIPSTPAGEPDYDLLVKRTDLYRVKNTANEPLVLDWDMELMPEDIHDEFKSYLSQKYITYNLQHLVGKITLVAIMVDGNRTVNFLKGFMNEKQYPTLIPYQEGKEVVISSKFVIPAGETVICTERQIKSLERYEKIKHTNSSDEDKTSDWLGFLIFTQIAGEKKERMVELQKSPRSYVTEQDLLKSHTSVDPAKLVERVARQTHNIIRATEDDA